MTTLVDTTPSASGGISDPTVADTITVADGPLENGFQTTQVTFEHGGLIYNFANKTAFTIDGNNHGDAVVFDNPNPAAGLTSLTVQNLGAGSTINGVMPPANSADIVVATLNLQADAGIGATTLLETEVNTLSASTSTGGIHIFNGVVGTSEPTLNITGLRVTGASGDIGLTNNGTVDVLTNNDFIEGPGNIFVGVFGGISDLNTGGQTANSAIYGSASGLVDLRAAHDMNLGDNFGSGNVGSFSGSVTLNAGGNIAITNGTVVGIITGSGGLAATAGGNITMAGATANQFYTGGGAIALTTGAAGTLTIDGNNTIAVLSNGGNITLSADFMSINQLVDAVAGNVLLQPVSAARRSASEPPWAHCT